MTLDSLSNSLLLLHSALVFFMQVGFVSLETGYGRAKNVRNVMVKNLANLLLVGLGWWAVGFAFSQGNSAGGFLGVSNFFTDGSDQADRPWLYSWTFCLSTVSIVSGCLAERTAVFAYPIITLLLCLWVHPVAAHWAWNRGSWLLTMHDNCEFLDFAGGTAVHVVGGLTGLIGAAICGPRIGRFEEGRPKPMPGHDVTSVAMGTFFLWFGWFGFNCGSAYLYEGVHSSVADRVALNMTLAASTSGLAALIVDSATTGTVDLCVCCNALLSGLVIITPAAGFVTSWASVVYGLFAGVLYLGGSRLLLRLHIDDPLDSSAIHFVCGFAGTLLLPFLARPSYVKELTRCDCGGFVYGEKSGLLLGLQVLGTVVISAWTAVFAAIAFYVLKRMGRLRVDQATEFAGLDNMEHGGPAYPEFNLVAYGGDRER